MPESKMKKKYVAFSLIEVLIALFIFSMAIAGVVSAMIMETKKATQARNEVIAGQLAQEGIELVRNIRDNNWLTDNNAFNGIDNGNKKIDYNNDLVDGDYKLYLTDNGLYSHTSSGSETAFQRKIIVSGSGTTRTISSVVAWEGGSLPSESNLASECISGNKCFYVEVILGSRWGDDIGN